MSMDPTQFAIAMSVPTLAVLIGILVNNSRLSDLRAYMDQRFSRIDQQFARLAGDVAQRTAARRRGAGRAPEAS
jgi:hypothetical protein